MAPPNFIQKLYQSEKKILDVLKEGIQHFYVDIMDIQQHIQRQCHNIPSEEQDFDTIYTDGSFDPVERKAGVAAICIRSKSREIIRVSRHISLCEFSTEAEIQAVFLGLILMETYGKARKLKTDSQATINAMERKLQGRQLINEKFKF